MRDLHLPIVAHTLRRTPLAHLCGHYDVVCVRCGQFCHSDSNEAHAYEIWDAQADWTDYFFMPFAIQNVSSLTASCYGRKAAN